MSISLINFIKQFKDKCNKFYRIASENKSKQFSFHLIKPELSRNRDQKN